MLNTRAMIFMTAAMAAFAVTDALIKHAAEAIGTMQCLMLVSVISMAVFLVVLRRNGERFWTADALGRPMLIRTAGEVVGSAGFVGGLALVPLSTVTALAQAQPLVLTAAAAIFLKERVGWRRWAAVVAGFIGMMIILRPGREAFDPALLLPIAGIFGLTARDLGTRLLPPSVSTAFAAAWALFVLTLVGAVGMMVAGGYRPMTPTLWAVVSAAAVTVSVAFVFITLALRKGEVSAIAPFRYTRILFAMSIAWVAFGERPDAAVWIGLSVILASGLYAFWRERRTGTAPAT
ncbi:EamA family transporter [Alphaproteobacteria bacterium GH1-50]|uniref:EamA family transporter n=1 Tax=Kangsaoukella pontilimi TaxID=2691042 RepID=A0A7C9IFK3_9RHOB|nr:EamA family transporter [Kangsaoukella pontilimi]